MLAFNKTVLGNEKIVRFWDSGGNAIGTAESKAGFLCSASDTSRCYIQTSGHLRIINPLMTGHTHINSGHSPSFLHCL